MFPPLQWDEFHLKAWSWLRGGLLQGRMQFGVECDLVQYENKDGTIEGIHLLNLQGENSPKGVQKPSQKLVDKCCMRQNTNLKELKESLKFWSNP
jgi:hypothetical protein